ncbi:hypothetical protein ACI2WT_22525 [Lysinibacillus fusiformis]
MNYDEFKSTQLRLLRKNITQALEDSNHTTFHDLLKNQVFDIRLLNDTSWTPISRKALYSVIQTDSNPTLDTLIKVCYLLDIDLSTLTKNEEMGQNAE